MDQAVPEKLDMGFLFNTHEVLQVECMIVKYKATRINTSVVTPQNVIIAAKCNINAKCNKNRCKM